MEKLKGFIVGAGHEAQVFQNCLNRMEENICRCGRTPSEVGEEFVSSEDKGRMELLSGNWTCRIHVFLWTFYFLMFLSQLSLAIGFLPHLRSFKLFLF